MESRVGSRCEKQATNLRRQWASGVHVLASWEGRVRDRLRTKRDQRVEGRGEVGERSQPKNCVLSQKARDIWTGTHGTTMQQSKAPNHKGWWLVLRVRGWTTQRGQNKSLRCTQKTRGKDKKYTQNKQASRQVNKQKMEEEGRGLLGNLFSISIHLFVIVLFGWSFMLRN